MFFLHLSCFLGILQITFSSMKLKVQKTLSNKVSVGFYLKNHRATKNKKWPFMIIKIRISDFIIRHLLPYFLSKDICWPSGLKGMIKTSNVLILYNYDFHPTPPWVVGISLLWGIMTWQVGRVEKYDYHSTEKAQRPFLYTKAFWSSTNMISS